MQVKMFSVPAFYPGEEAEEMNRFLRASRVLSLEKHLVGNDTTAFWAICISYLERSGDGPRASGAGSSLRQKVDYKEILSEEDFAVFARLREARKGMAERDGVPQYAVFTNEQLAAMVTGKTDSLAAMGRIDGVGSARLEKYGAVFLEILTGKQEAVDRP